MADLKQALMWLAEGKKIRNSGYRHYYYRYLDHGILKDTDDNNKETLEWYWHPDGWELYEEPKPITYETDPLEDDAEYIVWDKNNYRTWAYWDDSDKVFYPMFGPLTFALDVKTWKRLPEGGK